MIRVNKSSTPWLNFLYIKLEKLIPYLEKHGYIIEPYVCPIRIFPRHWLIDTISGSFSYDITECTEILRTVVTIPKYGYLIKITSPNSPGLHLDIDLFRLLPYLEEEGGYHIYKK